MYVKDGNGNLKSITFEIPVKPFGKQRPRVVSRGKFSKAYTPVETVNYEALVKFQFLQEAQGMTFPEDAPLSVQITAKYEVPKSTSKKKRQMMLDGYVFPTKKPDSDNIAKVVCDSLNGVAYHDDAAVVWLNVVKVYDEFPSVTVRIAVKENV